MIPLADIKAGLGLDLADTGPDDYLTAQTELVQGAIEVITGRRFVRDTYTERWRFPSSGVLRVKEFPLVSITALYVDGTLLATGDYTFDAKPGRILRGQYGAETFRGARVVDLEYIGGYDATQLPAGLKHAFLAVMGDRLKLRSGAALVAAETSTERAARVTVADAGTVAYETSSSSDSSAGGYDRSAAGGVLGAQIRLFELFRDPALLHGAGGE